MGVEGDTDEGGGGRSAGKEAVVEAAALAEAVAGGGECLAGAEDNAEVGGVDKMGGVGVWLKDAKAAGVELAGGIRDEEEVHVAGRRCAWVGKAPARKQQRQTGEHRLARKRGKQADGSRRKPLTQPASKMADDHPRGCRTACRGELLKARADSCTQLIFRMLRKGICHLPMRVGGLRSKWT